MRSDPARTPRDGRGGPQTGRIDVSRGPAHGFGFALPWALVIWALLAVAVIALL